MITVSSSCAYDVTGSGEPPDKGAGNPTWQDHYALLTTSHMELLNFFLNTPNLETFTLHISST